MTNLDISLQFYDNLKRFILTKVSNPEDANDILQDSLLKAQSNIHLLKESTKFTSWLYQIIRNSIIDYYRVRKVTLNIDETNIEDQFEYVEENDNNVLAKCLKMLLKQLPDKYREALELSELSDMSQSELSHHLSLTRSGTKSRIQRAKKKLRDIILQCCKLNTDKYGNVVDHKCNSQIINCC